MATPRGSHIGESLEAVRDTMIDLFLITFTSVGFGYAFGYDFLITFLVASVPAVFTLIAESVQQEVIAESTENQLVELLLDEFVPIHLMYLVLAFTNSTLTTKGFHRPLSDVLLDEVQL